MTDEAQAPQPPGLPFSCLDDNYIAGLWGQYLAYRAPEWPTVKGRAWAGLREIRV